MDRFGSVFGSVEQVWVVSDISFQLVITIKASLRGLLEFHGDVHQADLLSSAFTQSREVLNVSFSGYRYIEHARAFVKMSIWSAVTRPR